MPESYGQLPPPPDPGVIDEEARRAEEWLPEWLRGCGPIIGIGILAIILILIALGFATGVWDDDSPRGTSSSRSPSTSPSTSSSTSATPSESASQPETGGTYAPPTTEDLPPGAVLYTGTSGAKIGCITCDGQSRFLHINRSGVAVGDAQRPSQEVVWNQNGKFTEFGANISGRNEGRYGYNLFANGTTYMAGCSMEIGETSCRQQRPNDVAKGDLISIIIGEGGTMVNNVPASRGDFVVDWWFVFVPAA